MKETSKMKKLMIAAAIVCAATFANAAAVGWSCAGLGSYSGDAYDVFVIGQKGVTSVAQITALIEGGTDVSSYAFGAGNVSGTGLATVSSGNSGKTLDVPGDYEAFYIIFNTASQMGSKDPEIPAATKYLAITKDQAAGLRQTPGDKATSIGFSALNQATYANNADNWKSVPEPTSGLLLLLGVAGLALKRRRA